MTEPNTLKKAAMVIKLNKDFLTHLEKKQNLDSDRLHLELFDDFLNENERISQTIEKRKEEGKSPLRAKSYYFVLHGEREEADARVLEYNNENKRFLIEFKSGDKVLRKHAGRLNLQFVDFETREQIEQRRNVAQLLRREAQSKLDTEKLFITELAKRYDYIKLPRKFKTNILQKLTVDLN